MMFTAGLDDLAHDHDQARIRELEAALRPFAEAAATLKADAQAEIWLGYLSTGPSRRVNLDDFRRAHRLLFPPPSNAPFYGQQGKEQSR